MLVTYKHKDILKSERTVIINRSTKENTTEAELLQSLQHVCLEHFFKENKESRRDHYLEDIVILFMKDLT